MSHEEEDTCHMKRRIHVCHMMSKRIHTCHAKRTIHECRTQRDPHTFSTSAPAGMAYRRRTAFLRSAASRSGTLASS
jgi:hypothetical protein